VANRARHNNVAQHRKMAKPWGSPLRPWAMKVRRVIDDAFQAALLVAGRFRNYLFGLDGFDGSEETTLGSVGEVRQYGTWRC
jgi:hypothetical protein